MTSRYRQSMTEAYNQVQLSEKEITKLKNGVKVLGNALPNRALAQKMADKANKEMGHDADVYQSPFNNRFYVRIKEENLNEQDHEISMARGELEAISDKALKLSSILQGKSDEGNPLEAWVQSKITKAKDYINSVADYMEYNPDMANEGKKVECPQCKGKGCDHCNDKGYHMVEEVELDEDAKVIDYLVKKGLNAKDAEEATKKHLPYVKKTYGNLTPAQMAAKVSMARAHEEVELEEMFSDAQIAQLKKAYGPLRDKKISIDNANKMIAMFNKLDKHKDALEKLYKADIPFVSSMASSRLISKHGYKATQLSALRKEGIEPAVAELKQINELYMTEAEATVSRFKGDKEAENIMSLAKQQGVKATRSGNQIHLKGVFRKVMDMSLALQRNGMKVEGMMNEGTMIGGIIKHPGQPSAEYGRAKTLLRTFMSKAQPAKGAEEKVLKFMFDDQLLDDLYDASQKTPTKDVRPMVKARLKQLGVNEEVDLEEENLQEYTTQQIKMAYGVANDKRYKGGNYSGAVKAIEKIAKGLSNHPDVKKVLQRTNEDKEIDEGKLADMFKAGKSASEIAKALGMGVDLVKKLVGEQASEKEIDTFHKKLDKLVHKSFGHSSDEKKKDMKKEQKEHPAKMKYEEIAGLKKKAEKSGMPYSILKKVYDRGMAAWRGGHRPGATQQQWAFARVNSFVTKSSGTWGGADKDLAAKVKGE